MVAVFNGTAHKKQHRVHRVRQDIPRRVGRFVAVVDGALGAAGGFGGLDLLRQHRAIQNAAVVHHADVDAQRGKAIHAAGQVVQLLVGALCAALGKDGQVGIGVAHGHVRAEQRVGCHRVERLPVGVAVHGLFGRKKEALPQRSRGNVPGLHRLHPERHLAGGRGGVVLNIIIQPADVIFQGIFAVDLRLVGFVRLGRAGFRGAVGVVSHGGGLGSRAAAVQRVGHKAGVQHQRQRQTGGKVAALLRLGVVSQPRGGHQQHQRRQRQVNELAGGKQRAAAQQPGQPGRGERLVFVAAERRVHQQRREGKAQPQQGGVAAEARRQMQRHRQQCGHGEHPLAEGRDPHGQRRQRREEQQVCQPPQKQRGRKAQVEHIRREHRRRAGKVKQRVLVGLQFVIFLMAVERFVGRCEQLGGELLPREDRRVLVLQGGVLVAHAAEARRRGHLAHPPIAVV